MLVHPTLVGIIHGYCCLYLNTHRMIICMQISKDDGKNKNELHAKESAARKIAIFTQSFSKRIERILVERIWWCLISRTEWFGEMVLSWELLATCKLAYSQNQTMPLDRRSLQWPGQNWAIQQWAPPAPMLVNTRFAGFKSRYTTPSWVAIVHRFWYLLITMWCIRLQMKFTCRNVHKHFINGSLNKHRIMIVFYPECYPVNALCSNTVNL